MASTTLLSQISRSNTYPEIVSVTTEKNKGYISIDTSSWTEQMKSEIPGIKLTVYTEKNLTNIKYTPVSFILDTSKSICITVYDVPAEFDLSIEPLFDKHCIHSHNQLVKNGIEDPPEWVETDTFPISLTFDDVMETP